MDHIAEGIIRRWMNEVTVNYDPPANIEHRATLDMYKVKEGQENIKFPTITGIGQFKLTTGRSKDLPSTSIYLKEEKAKVYQYSATITFYDKDKKQYGEVIKYNDDDITNAESTWYRTESHLFWTGLPENNIQGLSKAKNIIRVFPKVTAPFDTSSDDFPRQLLDSINALILGPSSAVKGSDPVDTLYLSRTLSIFAQRLRLKYGESSVTVLDQIKKENKKLKNIYEVYHLGRDYHGGPEQAIACSSDKTNLQCTGMEEMIYGKFVPTVVGVDVAASNYTAGPLIRRTTSVAVMEFDI